MLMIYSPQKQAVVPLYTRAATDPFSQGVFPLVKAGYWQCGVEV